MVKKETAERREFFKPMRCVGGYMLAVTVIANALSVASNGLIFVAESVFTNEFLAQTVFGIIYYGCMAYAYYLAYLIFIKKYVPQITDLRPLKKKSIIPATILCALGFMAMQLIWQLWGVVLEQTGYYGGDEAVSLIDGIYICLLAPVFEELVFRHMIMKTLQPRYGTWVAIVISALSFGIFHGTFTQSIPAVFIGLLFAVLDQQYHSLVPSLALHIINNTLSVITVWLPEFELSMTLMIICTVLLIVILIAINFRKLKLKEIFKPVTVMYHSIAFMIFLIVFSSLIITEVLL